MIRLPPNDWLVIEHNAHVIAQETIAEGVAEIWDPNWLPGEKARALSTGSVFQARWLSPSTALGPDINIRAAASIETLLAGIEPEPARRVAGLVNDLRVAVRESDIECGRKAEALRAIGRIADLVEEPKRIIVPG